MVLVVKPVFVDLGDFLVDFIEGVDMESESQVKLPHICKRTNVIHLRHSLIEIGVPLQ